ncbi:ATP-binding protein [Cryptosporangium aurantiacum]|uniref:ATPase family associated with various cellular activities (AAA) n=1 Tax=Cryptosporangium aurantiacum TaxID=134849 RepID=A0A1M7N9Q7_9ACTN|nr:ATP-binding protein [Cryptosporangium aurantiacum]SHN00310.1 ATPase family associated with various cellular activities (AAA) [Cryptosporangium aurantiacum]
MRPAEEDPLLASLLAAVAAAAGDIPLRLHVAGLLLDRGRAAEALEHCSTVLRSDPANEEAIALLRRASAELGIARPGSRVAADRPSADPAMVGRSGFDWDAAEAQVQDLPEIGPVRDGLPDPVGVGDVDGVVFTDLTLADVVGASDAKERIERGIAPIRNPALARAFGKRTTGGMLLYGPPGCGKAFVARAIAGELRANFYRVGRSDVLDRPASTAEILASNPAAERRLRAVFATARRSAPCVLFLDDVDAIGPKRSRLQNPSTLRAVVNQLLFELDSLARSDHGVFVLASTTRPWDLDPALRRAGRLDRMVLIAPPDADARRAILRYQLRDLLVADFDLGAIAEATAGYSAADLRRVVDTAADTALSQSLRRGHARPIEESDVQAAVRRVRPSVGTWLDLARAAAGPSEGSYEDLHLYLRTHRRKP